LEEIIRTKKRKPLSALNYLKVVLFLFRRYRQLGARFVTSISNASSGGNISSPHIISENDFLLTLFNGKQGHMLAFLA